MSFLPPNPVFDAADLAARAQSFSGDTPLTAASVLQQIAGWTDLTARRRQDLSGAVKKACAVAGLPPEVMLLTPERLRATVLTKSPAAWNLSPVSKSTVVTGLRRVLERLGTIDPVKIAPSPAWRALQERIDQRGRMSLVALMGFCSRQNIEPARLTDEVLDQFELWLTERTLQAEPRTVRTTARRAWNRAVKEIDGWPPIILSLQSRRGQLLLPFTSFPESFQTDVAAYQEKLVGNDLDLLFGVNTADQEDPFEHQAAFKPNRPMTVETKLQHIKMVANALHRTGIPLPEIVGLASLVTPITRPKAIITLLYNEGGKKTRSPRLGHAVEILRQIAKYHAGCSPSQVKMIADWGKTVRPQYNGMTPRNRALLAKVTAPATLQVLLALPEVLLEEAEDAASDCQAQVAAQRALLLELLCKCPFRLGNLLGLRLDKHLLRPDPKTNRISMIMIPAEEAKNGQELTFPISETTAARLDIWIQKFRLFSSASGSPYLFPGKGMGPMTRAGIRDSIKAITDERLGAAINPHAFRHLAGFIFLKEFPGAYEDVRRLLGHKSITTTTRFYCGLEGESAAIRFDKILENQRQTLGVRATKRKRPAKKRATKGGRR